MYVLHHCPLFINLEGSLEENETENASPICQFECKRLVWDPRVPDYMWAMLRVAVKSLVLHPVFCRQARYLTFLAVSVSGFISLINYPNRR